MYLLLFATLIFFVLNFKYIKKPLSDVDKKAWVLFTAILVLLLIVYWFFVPNVLKIYGDEPNIITQATHYSGELIEGAPVMAIFHLAFLVFGFSNAVVIKTNLIFSLFNLFLLFGLLQLMFRNTNISVLGALFLSITESYIKFSTCAYNVIIALTFALISSIAFWLFIRHDKLSLNVLMISSLVLASLTRVEYVLLTLASFVWWIVMKKIKKKSMKFSYWAKNIGCWAIVIVLFLWSYYPLVHKKYSLWAGDSKVSFGIINMVNNMTEIFSKPGMVILMIVFAFFLLVSAKILHKRHQTVPAAYLLSISMVFAFFYLQNSYFADHFYPVISAFSLFIFAVPFSELFKKKGYKSHLALAVLFILMLMIFLLSVADANTDIKDFYGITTKAPEILEAYVPEGCTVIAPYPPNVMMGTNIKSIAAKDALNLSTDKCLYFLEDYLCTNRTDWGAMTSDCEKIRDTYCLRPELVITSENGLKYTLFRVSEKPCNLTKISITT